MKSIPWKKVAIGTGAIGLIALAFFYYTNIQSTKPAPSYINPAFGEYISSYTAGVLSSGSSIVIVLSKDAVDSTMVGKESSVDLFGFRPSISGKTTWLDKNTIEFKPEQRLPSGQAFEAKFYLSKLMEVPPELKTFEYSFQIMAQNFEVSIDNVKPYVKTELKRQKIEGTLMTADFAENAAVEQMISSIQEGKDLKVTWTHAAEGKQHNFIVEDVARKNEASKVKVAVKGNPLGVDRGEDKEVEIPSLSDFKLVDAKVVQNPNQYVILQFSDPLKEKQDLNGLINIAGVTANLDFDIHDNEIWVYPDGRQSGTKTVTIDPGVRNILDFKMKNPATAEVVFEQLAPMVRFNGDGTILPSTDGLVLPFEAVNLNAVDVSILRVFENNMLQFFQVNNLGGEQELYRVGKRVLKKTISLENSGVTDFGKWNRFTLDLSTLINTEPGAIYQVKLGFKKKYSVYNCDGEETEGEDNQTEFDEDTYNYDYGDEGGYYDEDYYYYEDYDWEQRDNPCHNSYYYRNRAIKRNILASDLGITSKRGSDGKTIVFVTDLKTAKPLADVQIELYDFYQQLLGTATTSAEGKAEIKSKELPFALIAKSGQQRGYLKLQDGESLSLSNFDVSGEVLQEGLKGFIYGDRGVWRPGDSLYLTFILEDKGKVLPPAHPVVFELQNPQGQIVNRLVKSTSENGFYSFATATHPDAPTGNWTGRVKVGGTEFSQNLKIETVKPNRLKINLDFGAEKLKSDVASGTLEVKWLHGAPARNLKAEFDMLLSPVYTSFPKYESYNFEDPSRNYSGLPQTVIDENTNEEGKLAVSVNMKEAAAGAPGMMNAVFRGKVFEESGNFSVDRISIPYSPYASYVGMKLPEGEEWGSTYYFDRPNKIEIVTLDDEGKPLSRNLKVTMYKMDTRWWWDNSYGDIATYTTGTSAIVARKGDVVTSNGKGSWTFEMKKAKDTRGRYYVRIADEASGHSTGTVVYIDEPGWYSRVQNERASGAANLLSFKTDKQVYTVGEKVNITIPGTTGGRALVSIENGTKVVRTEWVETSGDTKYSFEVTPEMSPNAYVNISFLQPHAQTTNDRPIRLYGISYFRVEDPKSHLEPVISMPDELQPGQEVKIKVSEKTNRKMTYTVAIVDEGLLDLTKFKTPDPWNRFYAREALGVRTWDLYDDVMGAFGAQLERMLSIGGDGEGGAKEDDPRANRFKPVVKYFGPYTLDGSTQELKFTMPQYIGSVKTMVVAGYDGAYGKTEKVTPVRKPLMVLATLPRVLGPEENVKLPITLFTQKGIKNVKVEVKAKGPVSITGDASKSVTMPSSGDLTVDFDLTVKSETGIAQIEVIASSGSNKATDIIEITVRNPNLPVTVVTETIIEAGKTWNNEVNPVGISGTNTAVLEISNIPAINMGHRLRYLIQYPYGCIEQTTSSVFPQLYLAEIKELTEVEQNSIQFNVTQGIERLRSFIQRDGGFGYWPGAEHSDPWGTTYAGHFLVEAQAKGYFVPEDMLKRWKKYQKAKALEWRYDSKYENNSLMQAYRLYTLSLAGAPELGAMNRLREHQFISTSASWMLAAAYAKAGQPEAARKMITSLSSVIPVYRELGYSYGSHVRDKALILETLTILGEKTKGFEVLRELSKYLSNYNYWMSTQETAMSLKAVTGYVGLMQRGEIAFAHTIRGKTIDARSTKAVTQINIPITGVKKESVSVKNESKGTLFARVITEGTPAQGKEEAAAKDLSISISYTDTKGNPIDVLRLEQGTEFVASVTVKHSGIRSWYENLALSQVFPSGWEISNLRLTGDEEFLKNDYFDYQDIRDDRVYTYFNLAVNGQRTYKVMLTAAYAGKFYLPATSCEAMYDNTIYARNKGTLVEVVKPVTQ